MPRIGFSRLPTGHPEALQAPFTCKRIWKDGICLRPAAPAGLESHWNDTISFRSAANATPGASRRTAPAAPASDHPMTKFLVTKFFITKFLIVDACLILIQPSRAFLRWPRVLQQAP